MSLLPLFHLSVGAESKKICQGVAEQLRHPRVICENGMTALDWACMEGHLDIIGILLEAVADEAVLYTGCTPSVSYACHHGHVDIANLRLAGGALPNEPVGDDSRAALHWAASGGRLDAARVLLEAAANVDLPDGQGETALHIACSSGHMSLVRLLL